jgi:hypothetical protein
MKLDISRLNVWLFQSAAIAIFQFLIYQLESAGALPTPMAIHWGITMQPDGFVSVSEFALTCLVIQLLIWLPSVALSIWAKAKVRIKNLLLLVGGIVFWLLTGILTASLLIQVGAADATAISFPLPLFVFIIVSVPLLLVFLLAMPEIVVGESVEVKLRGFTVMSFPPEEIVGASVGSVSAREFGGWGIRLTRRKIGFIPSNGPAVKLNLQDGTEVSIRSKASEAIVRQIEELIS